MKVLVTGGGTGGHFYPALSVMKRLKDSRTVSEVCYLGTGHGLESELISSYDWINFISIRIRGLSRQSLWRFLLGLVTFPIGMVQGLLVILKHSPDVIYGTGGYASFPVSFWGAMLGVPVVIHELNIQPGLTNRLLAPIATHVALSYPETKAHLNSNSFTLVGTPIRPQLRSLEEIRLQDEEYFGLNPNLPVILVFGGSKGSSILVDKVLSELENDDADVRQQLQFLIQTGEHNYETTVRKLRDLGEVDDSGIRVVKYIKDMDLAYKISDLVVCRGGASTMAELIATKKPAIIVPWSGAAENHQYYNAKLLSDTGAAIMVQEDVWSGFLLMEEVRGIFGSTFRTNGASSRLVQMSERYGELRHGKAADKLIDLFKDVTHEESYVNYRPKA